MVIVNTRVRVRVRMVRVVEVIGVVRVMVFSHGLEVSVITLSLKILKWQALTDQGKVHSCQCS